MQEHLEAAAKIALSECLNLGRTERLLVVCDPPCFDIGNAFWQVGRTRCREAVMVQIAPRKQNGNEPPEPVGEWFSQFDVAVMPTSKSLSHTEARRKACAAGTRIATLPGITNDSFLRTMQTDWERLGVLTRKVAAQLSAAKKVRVHTAKGTDITFQTGGRVAKPDDGRINSKGAFGNLPAGEAFLAPLEGTAEGVIVFDGSFPLCGVLQEPLILKVKKGRVSSIGAHAVCTELEELFAMYKAPSRTIAEFGVGTLDVARITGTILEDEKVKGTVHLALGDNASMGGTVHVPMHLDGIIMQPDVYLDDILWMQNGSLVS